MGIENNNKIYRFVPKDSQEELDKMNVDMTSKVKLVSRNEATQDSSKVKQQDKEIRKFRRSQERLKSIKEREVIRYHKHNKANTQLNFDNDPNKISHENLASYNGTPTTKKGGFKSFNPRQVTIQSDGENKSLLVNDSFTLEFNKNIDKINSNDYGFFLQSKYDKPQMNIFPCNQAPKLKKASSDNNSPLKKWNKHARTESQGRIQLLSHVCYS